VESVLKIAVISDIHGNFPALSAVFDDFTGIDVCICSGDIVGYYPYVNEVCTALRKKDVFVVRGNHDSFVVGQIQPDADKSQAYRVEWTRKCLVAAHVKWLASLPIELIFKWDSISVVMRHASPWDEETYLYPDSEILETISLPENSFLFLGHTHYPMTVNCGNGFVNNPGSVGQPRDWDSRACYAVFDTVSQNFQVKRVAYDVAQLQNELRKMGWEQSSIDILGRCR